jgi:hypothetical protein
MELRALILREHSRAQTDKIVKYIDDNPERFAELVRIFLAGPYRVTQRAGWPLAYCVERHPELIKPHLKPILDHLKKPDIHDAVKRNTLRLLQFIDVPKRFHGRVADICFEFLQNKKEPIAVRCFSLTVLGSIAAANPELKQELAMIVEDQLPYATPGFAVRAKRVLQSL